MKITIEMHGQVLEGELDDESAEMLMRDNWERYDGNKARFTGGGTFSLSARHGERPLWRDA